MAARLPLRDSFLGLCPVHRCRAARKGNAPDLAEPLQAAAVSPDLRKSRAYDEAGGISSPNSPEMRRAASALS